tara:strand:- start:151 stop:606 length:456 start_codon:yes stop_codon:yes gene_type:complete
MWNTKKEPFMFLSCWKKLRLHPKWGRDLSTERKRKREHGEDCEDSNNDEHGAPVNDTSGRPIGRKKMKDEKFSTETMKPLIQNSDKMVAAMNRKVEVMEYLAQLHTAKMFSEENGATAEECQEYFSMLRKKAKMKLSKGKCNLLVTCPLLY